MSRPKKTVTAEAPKKRGRKPKFAVAAAIAPIAAAVKPVLALKKKGEPLETLKGFRDILPLDAAYWRFVKDKVQKIADDYGFRMIETPILEFSALFKRSLGKHTDVVEKEMFEFEDKGGDAVALRPEGTAGIARAYINHGMQNLPQPLKVFYEEAMFRYENPQSGRLREHHQAGFEILGSASSAADAQLILIGRNLLNDLGVTFNLQINSIGCPGCREAYKNILMEHYRPLRRQMCENCKHRLLKNPLRLLDCKEEACQKLRQGAPHIVDYLDEECKKHFMQVLEFLDEIGVSYDMNPFLVRGLDYYTRTVFEFWPTGDTHAQSSLINGGRYDNLIEELGGLPTPAVGFGAGVERLISRIKEEGVVVPPASRPDIFVAHLGLEARKRGMLLFEDLRKQGFSLAENFAKESLKQQLEAANKMRAKFTLILGQKEMQEKTILLRDMDAGVQETIDQKKISVEMRRRLDTMNLAEKERMTVAPEVQA